MKKKILFMLINMNVGGTEKALLNMLAEIPKEKYEITLFMLEEYGGFLNYIPNNVDVKYLDGYNQIKTFINQPIQKIAINAFKKGNFIHAFILLFLYLISKVFNDRSIVFKYVLKDFKKIETDYDAAVAYAGPMDLISYFVINKIKAKKKVQWIHFDITKVGFNKKMVEKIYKRFDKIFVVSEEGKNKLLKVFPKLKNQTDTFINIISLDSITEMANENIGFEDHFTGIRILTVGRLSKEKGQDLTIPVLAKLKKDGYNVRWYCIGDGSSRSEYEELIYQYGIKNEFLLLGAKTNPYPFMKQCDIYVQPSRHEGYCITLSEVKYFNKPIVTTNFTGASEQIKNGISGLIVNFDEQEMYLAIKRLLEDKNVKNILEDNLLNEGYMVPNEINKLLSIAN